MNLKRSISKKSVPPAVTGGSMFVRRRRALIGPVVIAATLLTASALARPDIAARVWNSTAGLVGKKILATRSSNAAVAKTNAPIPPPPPAPPNFDPGDLVVFQADAILNNTTFSIVELSPTIPGQTGSGVQTIAISGTGANALRASGSATSTGYLATTNDGTLLSFDAHNSSTTSPTNANTLNPRGVGTFNSAGTFALQTTYTGTSGNQARSATSLNNTTWFIGDQGGFYSNGAVSASPTGNPRSVKSFGGTVYAFTASTSVAPVGTISAPTGGTFTGLPGLANGAISRQDFYLISSGINGATFDVLYVLDATSASAGTIFKYSLVGGSWTANGSYTTSFGGFGLAAAGSGTGAVLFATTGTGATSANSVIKLTDTAGYNSTISITTANNVTLFTAPAGTADKGIAFAPLSAAAPDLTTAVTGPSSGTVGTAYDYTIKVNNSGAASATGVKETFTLPSGVTFNTASGTDSFSCSEALGVVTCTGGSVTNGNSATITVNVTPTGAGTITLPAGAAVADPDAAIAESNENNNSSTIAVTTGTTENLPPGTYSSVTVNSGVAITITGNITITGCLTVNSGGTLNLGGNIISGSGCFTVNSGGTLAIGDPNGITTSGASGNVQVSGTRTFSTGASYVYAGSANQAVGNGLPATVANLKIANTGSVGNNTVTNNANQVVTGTLEIVTGIYSSHSDYVDVLIDVGGTLTLAADITVSGNWTNNGTFNNGGFKVTFDGATNQTIGGSNPSAFATLAISNTGAAGSNTVSLSQSVSDTALNVTSGIFDQGGASSLTSGTVTISGGATWQSLGAGSVALSGNVSNAGTIQINSNGTNCNDAQSITISSTDTTQRVWSGFGTFTIKDVHVSRQGGTAIIHVEHGLDDGNNGPLWLFAPGTCTGGTVYYWNPPAPGSDSSYQTPANWTPTRIALNITTDDVLVVDNAYTPTTTITNVPTETIGRFRVTNGASATLNAASGGSTLTIKGDGSTVQDLDVAGSSQLTLSGSDTLTVSLATGATGNINNLLTIGGNGNKLIAADANAITFPSATNCTVLAGYTGNPFGKGSAGEGANGSVIFNTDSIYTHYSGSSPFGDSSHNVVVFNPGSLAHFYTATGFEASGRTYANLEIGNASTEVDATDSGTGDFRFDNLTVNNTASQDSSLTFTGSGTGSILIFGNIRSTGQGIGAAATIANVSLTSGSGGIQIDNGAGITFDNIGNSRSILFGSDAAVASGTNLALGRIIQNNFLNPNAVLTVNGSITPNVGVPGYIVGNEQRIFTGPGPVDFKFDVGGPAAYSPLEAKNTTGAGSLTVQAKEPGLPAISGANKLQRYWALSGAGITTDLTFHYRSGAPLTGDVNGNEGNYVVFKYDGNLTQPPTQTVNTGNHTATVTSVNSFSSWTLAEPSAVPGTTDVSLSSGNLVISDVNGDDTDDKLTISLSGSNVHITDPSHTLNCGTDTTTINANTCEVPFALITGNIQVDTQGGDDTLTLDLGSGDFIPDGPNGGLTYAGGTQTSAGDKLSIIGGTQGTVTYNYTTANNGSIEMANFGTVTYAGLEPISNSGTATDVIFNLPAGGNVATLSDALGGKSRLDSTSATFEQTEFANPSGSVTINGGVDNDTITVGGLAANYPSLTINGNEGTDTVGFTGNTTFATGASLDVNLQDDPTPGVDNVFVNGALIVSGAGKIDIQASEDVTVNSSGKLQVENGELTVEANQQDPSTATDHHGVDVNGGIIQSVGAGNISIKGRGGKGAFDTMYGVIVWNTGKILSIGTGAITVEGTGGDRDNGGAPATPPSQLYGVYVYLSGSEISSVSGVIIITGTGGATDQTGSYGVSVEGGKIQQSGAGALTIHGTGGTCTGGSASFANSIGVAVVPDKAIPTPAGGIITSTGTGNISITGVAGDGGNGGSQGVRVDGPGKVTSVDGSITFNGTGATGAIGSLGISIRGAVTATGAGAISMTGTGADSTGAGPTHGVNVQSGGGVTAFNGNITITGTGGNGADNAGFDLAPVGTPGTGFLRTTGAGNITINADRIHIRPTNEARINAGANAVSISPKTPATFIDLGSTTDTTADLELSDGELDQITCGTLKLGDNNSESITVTADITRAVSTKMELTAGCDIVIIGGQVNTGGGTLLLDSGPSPDAVKPTHSGTDVTASKLSFGSDLAIVINGSGTTADTDYTQLNVSGDIDLTGVDLALSGTHTPAVGEAFTIVSNGSNSTTGNFTLPPGPNGTDANGGTLDEGDTITNFLGSSLNATITYQGGTNNDVVLTVTAAGSSDLTVTKSAPGSVPGGSDFTYTITVSNSASATATATGVSVSDLLPGGVTFVSVSPTPACSESAGTVTCTGLPDIPAGDSETVEIVVTAGSAPATVQNTASASATNDSGSPHTSTTSTFIITCITELLVNSTGDGGDANKGDGVCETGAANGVCTLRAAIEEANALNDICGYLTVKFAIPDNDPYAVTPAHFYYKDDGSGSTNGTVNPANIAVTIVDDSALPTSGPNAPDPDYPHSWWRIQPVASLPPIKVALDIDGYTQTGATPNTKPLNEGDDAILRIEIDGSQVGDTINGLTFTEAWGDYSIITGLVINHFNRASDLYVNDFGGHIFSGNFLGVDVSGTLGDGTDGTGVFLKHGCETEIGGYSPEDRNVISGHGGEGGAGIWINTSDNAVEGNYIGTDRNGAAKIPNTYGVIITGGDGNVIGDNVISGNANSGVSIGDGSGNLVEGNFIGTDKTGQIALPNKTGIVVSHGFLNFIGFGFGNVISGNTEDGVVLKDASCLNIVQTNLIGIALDGMTPLGNGGNGVEVYTGSTDNVIGEFPSGSTVRAKFDARVQALSQKDSGRGAKDSSAAKTEPEAARAPQTTPKANRAQRPDRKHSPRDRGPRPSSKEFFDQRLATVKLGAAKKQAFFNKRSSARKGASAPNITPETCGCPSGGNTIAYNGGDGVKVSSDGDLYNSISQNSIYSNFGLGINLVNNNPPEPPSTVTPNDSGDGDLGPNELQNFPVILDASVATGIVHFSFDTCYEGPYVIEFFSNAAGCDPSGHGEGGTYLGFKEVPGSGSDYYSDPLSLSPGDVITATATDYYGNTSEFSACFALAPAVVSNVSVALNGSASVAESGAANLVYRFSRDYTGAPLTVNFSATGTASSSNDYTILSAPNIGFNGSNGTVTFGTGVDHVDLKVDPTADADFEASETVIITVTSGAGYSVVNPSSATGTITDDNCPTSFLVTHANDSHDLIKGDGVCADEDQHCTLRAAIEEANALVNCGTISITFGFSTETTIVLPVGELLVQHNVNIIGPPTDPLTTYPLIIDGNGQYRAFHIDPGKIVSISNLTITDCVTSGDGGGILNNGALTLKGVTVNGNTAVNGGGIASLTNNALTLINTTISGNKSSGNGGGLYNDTGIATLTNVTIAYNTADSDGVGSESGGGIFVASGDVTLHNTIVTDNLKGKGPITAADDVGGVNLNAASSYNLIGIISSGGLNVGNNNQLGVASALLKPLQDNGGPTRTHALTYKSPAVDQGDGCVVSGCSLSSPVVDTDQRGKPRTPLNDGDDNGATGVDIGAYERQVTETRDVPTGDPSTVDVVDAIITFLCVEPCGGSRVNPGSTKSASAIAPSLASPTASLAAIDPAPLNSLQRPNNTVIGAGSSPPLPAFEVSTTATYTPPATVCFYLPSITDLTFFNTLKVLHREAGPNLTYGDSDDTLFEPPGGTTRFFASKLLCVQVQSFSAFAIAQTVSVGPTAEDATVSGQILDNQGNPVEGAALRMSGTQNRLTITDAEGKYHFEDVETNGFYVITPSRANFTFSPAQRSFSQLGANTEATFTGSASGGGLNPLDVTEYFVRQQYLDFLGREPDNSGFNFWVNNIESCGNDIGCREVKRIDTSAAFFLSIESRQTGYLIYRFYQAAYGEIPNTPVPLRLSEYTSDATRISKGVVVLQNGWQRTLENNTRAFAEDFVKRDRFVAAYPVTMTPVEFVDKLFANGQIPVTDGDHAAAIAEFGGAPDTSEAAARARALRRIAENSVLERRHFNRAFVLMQYFGYLRRDPNSGQDRDFSGFNFWLDKLDRFEGNFRDAEMVRAFLTSIEYRARISR